MKLRKLALAPIAVAVMAFAATAQANWTASFDDVVNGVSGTLSDTGPSGSIENYSLTLNFGSSGAAIGSLLTAVDIKSWSSYSSFAFTAPIGTWVDPAGTGPIASGGAAGVDGCKGSNGGFACVNATSPYATIAANTSYTFTFAVSGATGLNTTGLGAHVGAGFTQADGTGNAGIVSQLTTPVPEPEIYAMLAAGLGFMGFVARRRKQRVAA
jgi:hypothetical protein